MIELIERHRHAIVELCRQHQVKRLDVFGSASSGTFDPLTSDVDFVVTFFPLPPVSYKRHYVDLKESLAGLLGIKVDLVTERTIQNPYSRRAVGESRSGLYAA